MTLCLTLCHVAYRAVSITDQAVDAKFLHTFKASLLERYNLCKDLALGDDGFTRSSATMYIKCDMVVNQLRKMLEHAWFIATRMAKGETYNVLVKQSGTIPLKLVSLNAKADFKIMRNAPENRVVDTMKDFVWEMCPKIGFGGTATVYTDIDHLYIKLVHDLRDMTTHRGKYLFTANVAIDLSTRNSSILLPSHGHFGDVVGMAPREFDANGLERHGDNVLVTMDMQMFMIRASEAVNRKVMKFMDDLIDARVHG
jgi:hypothetical protein